MVTLMPHQVRAVEWLRSRNGRGLLWMDAGTGKTLTAIAAMKEFGVTSCLVLCPKAVIEQWHKEFERFGWKPARLAVTNYESLKNIRAIDRYDIVVCDESQLVNNPSAIRTRRLKKIESTYRVALSGTPMPNALWEAWSVIDWLSPGQLLRSFWAFRQSYCKTHPVFPSKIVGWHDGCERKFRHALDFHSFRVRREDVLTDLPDKQTRVVWTELGQDERLRYERLKKECILELSNGDVITPVNVVSKILRLRQLIDDPEALGIERKGSKTRMLEHLLAKRTDRLRARTLVFTEFSTAAHSIAGFTGGRAYTGAASMKERKEIVEWFEELPESVIALTAAGNLGLNLQAAECVIHFGVPWNWARFEQRGARAHRKGQTKEVEEIVILAKGTVDEMMWKLINEKRKLTTQDLLEALKQ